MCLSRTFQQCLLFPQHLLENISEYFQNIQKYFQKEILCCTVAHHSLFTGDLSKITQVVYLFCYVNKGDLLRALGGHKVGGQIFYLYIQKQAVWWRTPRTELLRLFPVIIPGRLKDCWDHKCKCKKPTLNVGKRILVQVAEALCILGDFFLGVFLLTVVLFKL